MNRTKRFIAPCLYSFGNSFINFYKQVKIIKLGVGDTNRPNYKNHIFILVDLASTKATSSNLDKIVLSVKILPQFRETYEFVFNTKLYTMFVFELTNKENIVNEFLKGRYSALYSRVEIDTYYFLPQDKEILLKTNKQLDLFVETVNKIFNTFLSKENIVDIEADFPPAKEEEIFNYSIKNGK